MRVCHFVLGPTPNRSRVARMSERSAGVSGTPPDIASLIRAARPHSTSSGHGTMVDFTVFIAIASLTACATPSSVNG